MNTLDQFKHLLQRHDWFYDYSDDHSVWQKGEKERADLYIMYKAFDPVLAKDTWNEHAPEQYRMK